MESLPHSTGAVTGNRTRILGVAIRDSSFEPSPPEKSAATRGAETDALPIELRPREWSRRGSNPHLSRDIDGVPAAFAAEPSSGVAPERAAYEEALPLREDGRRGAGASGGYRLSRSRELDALDLSDEVIRAELALGEERDDLEHRVREATDVQDVRAVGGLRRAVRLHVDEHQLGLRVARPEALPLLGHDGAASERSRALEREIRPRLA